MHPPSKRVYAGSSPAGGNPLTRSGPRGCEERYSVRRGARVLLMKVVMKFVLSAALWGAVLLGGGCSSKADKPGGAGKAFMDQTKQVPPRMEWNQDFFARSAGTITFRVA